jgi:hypothetical protein
MGIEFFKDGDGKVILGVRNGMADYIVRRESLYHVNADELEKFASEHTLNNGQRVRVALELNSVRAKYNLMNAVESHPADTSLARWIDAMSNSIRLIGDKVRADPNKFRLAIEAIEGPASKWAAMQDVEALEKMGIDVHSQHGISYELYQITRRWFLYAELLSGFADEAKFNLQTRNRPSKLKGLKGLVADAPGKETYVYGVWLPLLYERIVGKKFGISKDKDGQNVLKTTGVAFVVDVATVIGLQVTPVNVADHFNKAKRYKNSQAESEQVVPASK